MLLQRKKKKELWRYASKNFAQTDDGVQISQQQQQHHLQHRRHHHPRRRMSISSTSISLPTTNCFNTACTSTDLTQLDLIHCNTPPPPYSVGVYGMDYSGHSLQKHRTCAFPCQREQSQSGTFAENSEPHIEQSDYSCDLPYPYSNGICNSYEDFRLAHCEHSSESLKNFPVVTKQHKSTTQINTSPAHPSMQPTQGNNFASTAVNVFRTCCGCGFSSDSSTASIMNNVNAPSISLIQKKSKYHSPFDHSDSSSTMKTEEVLQDFNSLMKQLKTYQIDALLKAVKSRKSPSLDVTTNGQHMNCILVKRNSNAHEDLQLKTCRLFFWRDIVSISELKRSPVCPSAHDTIYMCCNPLHWCRIVPKGDIKMHSSLWVRLPESQTTVSTDRLDRQTVWCEVAYWELAQRIGTRFKTKNASFNIYNEGLQGSGFNEDMCLQNITNDKKQSTTPDVHNTRQKIGLGLTISREEDGIWLYNRSAVAIFLSSPSIKDSFSRAFKVMPGDCLKAFDSIKAQTFDYPSAYYPSAQLGPIDNHSMRISFVKGWGVGYKRQDITRCPCWLEVIFKQQR